MKGQVAMRKSNNSKFSNETQTKSLTDFQDVFSGIMENVLPIARKCKMLYATKIETPLGSLLGIADETDLYLLEFFDWRGLTREINRLRKNTHSVIFPGKSSPLISIENELKKYFKGKLHRFNTPLCYFGTPFQKQVWLALKKIPYGKTRSYYDIAKFIDKPTAYRAVANANGKNQFVIVIPCHRVINHNGGLGGYGAGLARKKWLLEHELSHIDI